MNLHIIILAAGKGTRMHSNIPKVLQQLGSMPLLEHVIKTAKSLNPKKIHVVYGEDGDLFSERFKSYDINWIQQTERLGTGHAVMQALPHIEQASQVLILYGDVPLITSKILERLIKDMPLEGLNLLSAEFSDPSGFGRIVRDDFDQVRAIVEHKDATSKQQKIKEINSGILVTTSKVLRNYLPRLHKSNAQGEYYLTDIVGMLHKDSVPMSCLLAINPIEVMGVNDKKQLAMLERQYQADIADNLMSQGLTLMDPARFDVRGSLVIEKDIIIDVNVVIEGEVIVGSGTTIGPNNFLKNVRIGSNVNIKANCVIEDAVISDNCVVGPFARIRPNSYLAKGAHVGNFVELKNTKIGENSKANHLSYLGDSVVGSKVNIGAGTITCNYDGANKYQTLIEDGVFVGSNTSLVAPLTLAKNTVVGAGSVITVNT
ncbi:MAG: bifunctional UDP-N-acetylglucosamine diphosphorylase/glucosamine-1-phosphate N-acetyltransferase GlmU, partial [Gammaproteobacteria bacterium]|nr:bifunctional UDP-N-acetylglucosamine diphosphorylase/glucosamine-1-phosphate N-acetyltransferase GlmU [Gammaproteobacteria bacterium]